MAKTENEVLGEIFNLWEMGAMVESYGEIVVGYAKDFIKVLFEREGSDFDKDGGFFYLSEMWYNMIDYPPIEKERILFVVPYNSDKIWRWVGDNKGKVVHYYLEDTSPVNVEDGDDLERLIYFGLCYGVEKVVESVIDAAIREGLIKIYE